jgi:hypothetical protein
MFFCDPPGRSDPESLYNIGGPVDQLNYIFFHDQESIHLDIHTPLFNSVVTRNRDLFARSDSGSLHRALVTSECDSDAVAQVCSQYKWTPYYYFYHGWAALDWYRGYDKTFLMPGPTERRIKKTFIAPNRIIAGKRNHRLEILYHIFKNHMTNNHISCPSICPAENISIQEAILPLVDQYPDIKTVFAKQQLPINFTGETTHPMHSCWLSLFNEAAESLLYLVTETVAKGRRQHLTEKIFKPIAMGMPFILVGTRGSLKYLRSYGFRTFGDIWDESYDDADDNVRIERVANLLLSLDSLSTSAKQELFDSAEEIIQHNWNHFYNGGFETVLWQELTAMLDNIARDFN